VPTYEITFPVTLAFSTLLGYLKRANILEFNFFYLQSAAAVSYTLCRRSGPIFTMCSTSLNRLTTRGNRIVLDADIILLIDGLSAAQSTFLLSDLNVMLVTNASYYQSSSVPNTVPNIYEVSTSRLYSCRSS
jgi:hypothetical protein